MQATKYPDPIEVPGSHLADPHPMAVVSFQTTWEKWPQPWKALPLVSREPTSYWGKLASSELYHMSLMTMERLPAPR